ncbi:putative germin-like protein 2-1 [Salvia miltiorrhiza]|uniref:putative germin-like protein 2-1 n=1 Tax=Salvia miltiorrhiza TaxID=226208 RepID=UPI0025AC67A3|nr:putative germin-like protein 2-1 [Salvia miltiorrhiza]
MDRSFILLSILALNSFSNIVFASDPSPLQDFCVADLTSTVRFNGLPCVDPATVTADKFFFSGLSQGGNTSNPTGAAVTPVGVSQMPGLNTLGLAMARLDYELNGFFPPHYHPRGSEIHTVLEGSMEVGFVTSAPNFKLYKKVLEKGDVFVVPVGLVHYQRNVGAGKTASIATFNSQNPGNSVIPNALFGSNPDIDSDYLAKSFALDQETVQELQRLF